MSVDRSDVDQLFSEESVAALIHEFDLVPVFCLTPSLVRIIRGEYLEKWYNQLREDEEREEMRAFLEYFIKRGKSRLESVELSGTLFPFE